MQSSLECSCIKISFALLFPSCASTEVINIYFASSLTASMPCASASFYRIAVACCLLHGRGQADRQVPLSEPRVILLDDGTELTGDRGSKLQASVT